MTTIHAPTARHGRRIFEALLAEGHHAELTQVSLVHVRMETSAPIRAVRDLMRERGLATGCILADGEIVGDDDDLDEYGSLDMASLGDY